MSKVVLVTGAAGYIGSVLCERLYRAGHDVWGIDNLYFGQKFVDYIGNPDAPILMTGDITKTDTIKKAIAVARPQVVIHLAAFVGMPICKKYPEEAVMVNTESTRLLLDAIDPSVHFIIPNTNSQYGQQAEICTEETPTNPISLYSVTKCIAEQLVLNRPNSTSLRLATVYGLSPTRMRDELLINFFVKELVQKKKLVLYEPHFKRNLVHINDVSDAFIHVMDKGLTGVYNVGDDALNGTKLELAERIAAIVGGVVEVGDGEDIDKRDYNVSSAKICKTGYNIGTDFTQNILELKEYYSK